MADDTRPESEGGPHAHGDHPPPWLGELCPESIRDQLQRLREEGERILARTRQWAGQVGEALDQYEAALATHHLPDDLHEALGTVTGAAALYEILDELADLPGSVR
ncbi:MAG: hypothetical protein JWM47_2475 [Acidimicrobiales bacterium]|nr:hypothetical protein [Acidimicrobiales bacterium]